MYSRQAVKNPKTYYVFGEAAAFEDFLRDTLMHDRVGDREPSGAVYCCSVEVEFSAVKGI